MVNQALAELKVDKHPHKTTIGRVARGFDFLGYHFSSGGLGIAPRTMDRFKELMARLYEQGADETRLGLYARRWWRWARAGVALGHPRGPWPGGDATAVLTIE